MRQIATLADWAAASNLGVQAAKRYVDRGTEVGPLRLACDLADAGDPRSTSCARELFERYRRGEVTAGVSWSGDGFGNGR